MAKKVKRVARSIQGLKTIKIVWGGFDDEFVWVITVDTVTFRVCEIRTEPHSKWFDPKTQGAGFKYEFAVATNEPPRLVWISGPVGASEMGDLTMFCGGTQGTPQSERNKDALFFKLEEGQKAIGDSIYGAKHARDKVTVTRKEHSKEMKKVFARLKARQESIHARFKNFHVLSEPFRHGTDVTNKKELHQTCVEAVCVLVQYDIENDSEFMAPPRL